MADLALGQEIWVCGVITCVKDGHNPQEWAYNVKFDGAAVVHRTKEDDLRREHEGFVPVDPTRKCTRYQNKTPKGRDFFPGTAD